MSFTFITPTYKRNPETLKLCLDCVESQTYKNWKHIIVVDDDKLEPHIPKSIIENYSNEKRKFVCLGYNSNNYGNIPRQLAIDMCDTDYIVFFDDDNVIFPNYLQVMKDSLGDVDMTICKIIHMGPLPAHLCPPPKVLDGNPPVLQNIDTLQIAVSTKVMKEHKWLNMGYMADGYTIQSLAQKYKYKYVNQILGVHM